MKRIVDITVASDRIVVGWCITKEPSNPVGHQWAYVHDDYDGPPDRRCGTAATLAEAIEAIHEIQETA